MLAIVILFLLHLAVLGLLWFGLRRPGAMSWIAGGCGALILGVVIYQTGLITGPTVASQLPPLSSLPSASDRQCREIMTLLLQNRAILEEPRGERLVVARELWEQLPEPVRNQIVSCAEQQRPDRMQDRPLEVVQQ